MARLVTVLVLVAALFQVATAKGETSVCVLPRCFDATVPIPTGLKVPDNRMRVILPESYDAGRAQGYPVLYLLQGAGDSYKWEFDSREMPDILELTRVFDLIVVMPDAGGDVATSAPGWYSDWFDGSREWETFHTQVVVPYVDHTFNTAGDGHRAIAGLSMGGYGAMEYAARHPGMFKAAASFSGVVDIRWGEVAVPVALEALSGSDIWGDAVLQRENWRAHNPTDLARNLAGTTILIATGDGTREGDAYTPEYPYVPPSGCVGPQFPFCNAIETIIWQANLSFIRALNAAGVPHKDLIHAGGHDWPYWRNDLAWALPQIMASIT